MNATKTSRALKSSLALTAVLLLAAPAAFGAELTREEYVAKVEPICKVNTKANEKILKGARGAVKEGEFEKAASQFKRAAAALEKTVKTLEGTPQPSEDEATLRKWLGYVSAEAALLRKGADALKAHDKFKAQSQVVRLTRNANLANGLVASFGFDYCSFDPSRFT